MPSSATPRAARGPVGQMLDVLGSIWFGVILLTILFVYSSIGSAGLWLPGSANIFSFENWYQLHVRQWRGLEMTEFEWFHWWPFDLLIVLICAAIVTATLRRIPFKPVNYGVWMIHTGLIILAIGSFIYFGTKSEGDAPVVRRAVSISVPGAAPTTLVALPGSATTVEADGRTWSFDVTGVDPSWELLSGDDKGTRAYKVSVRVQDGERTFIRELLAGYPQYTEDLLFDRAAPQPVQRAVNVLGTPLVDESITLALEPHPQRWFHIMNSRALFIREVGSETWSQRVIGGLPRYNDYLASVDDVWPGAGATGLGPHPISVELSEADRADPLHGTPITIDAYLRYAIEQPRRLPGGDDLDPVVAAHVHGADGHVERELRAFDPASSTAANGRVRFAWVDSPEALEALQTPAPPRLTLRVPATGELETITIDDVSNTNPELAYTPIAGTSLEYRVNRYEDALPLSATDIVAVAIVELRSPTRSFVRWVFEQPGRNVDFETDAEGRMSNAPAAKDESVQFVYLPGPAEATLVGGPAEDELRLVRRGTDGAMETTDVRPGTSFLVTGGTSVTVHSFAARTTEFTKPVIVPPEQRNRNADLAGRFTMIRITIPGHGSHWLTQQQYVFDRDDEVLFRYPQAPLIIERDGQPDLEVVFARERAPLPAPVILDDFHVLEHVGGFVGSTTSIRDWVSDIRFETEGGWTETKHVQVNTPREHEGYWFFQAQWDPPEPQRGYAGLNYTVLGVGNRNGVNIQLAGTVLSVIGMLYAFYVKPIIKRRQRQAAYEAAAVAKAEGAVAEAAAPVEEVAS